ncbi:MAG: DUF883 domain-containing protein [Sulfitobacter sp.]
MAKSPTTTHEKSFSSVDDLNKQIKTLKKDIAGLTKTVSDYSTNKAAEAKQNAANAASHLQSASQERIDHTRDQAVEFVRQQPGTAIGMAVGAGFLIGLLATQRR